MGIRTAIKPLGSRKGRYKKGTVLCSLSAGQSAIITFYPGIYYIRGQGAGAGGGNYAYPWGHVLVLAVVPDLRDISRY